MSLTALGPDVIGQRLYKSERVHVPVEHPDAITPEHMRHYWVEGYLAVENVFTPDEVRAGIDGLLHLIRGEHPTYKGVELEEATAQQVDPAGVPPERREDYVRKLMHFVKHEPRLGGMAAHPRLVGLCERLLGSRVALAQDMALLKPPRVGREKPWHQDTAYFNYAPLDGVIGTWTALDAATPENGCMHVIPRSHLNGPQPHFHDRDCQLPDEAVDVDADVVVPLRPGGALFFHGLLHHGTPPNQSVAKRRALQFHYASAQCRRIDDAEHAALFQEGDAYAGCRHWAMKLPPRRVEDRTF